MFRASSLARAVLVAGLAPAAAAPAHAAAPLQVQFSQCSEFVGLVPVPAAKARALLPQRYVLVVDAADTARLVVRMTDCKAVRVGALPARAGRVAQAGLLIVSPDGTATDPYTGINNYTLTYATNVPALALGLQLQGVPAALDAAMEYQVVPPLGADSALYASVAPELGDATRFYLDGTVNTPTYASTFLANWWRLGGTAQVRMQTIFPAISFDFASSVAFTTNPDNVLGRLTGTARVTRFAVTYRGTYDAATMVVKPAP